ncbi:hypothetical protein MPTK1_4g08350 [Marchantia polymorpha subsp. ruderalis]|uniref:Uncharacterized protein n=2 Tax=Marchantia polymorpha TaxID=3197 RepID=A0AAF6B7R0_MARPO|nr:hypothetical protein MARPO_0120s0011 [Marchantia polymorpha]BBN08044.1 hypothetical protein Mp_4g08350 [Marchantia polymorpha subsp. ruderalis]|eukprot:PTQ30728.1 hypothetical protein MARPO_0120s0011 [Marchantia polymorpha]
MLESKQNVSQVHRSHDICWPRSRRATVARVHTEQILVEKSSSGDDDDDDDNCMCNVCLDKLHDSAFYFIPNDSAFLKNLLLARTHPPPQAFKRSQHVF